MLILFRNANRKQDRSSFVPGLHKKNLETVNSFKLVFKLSERSLCLSNQFKCNRCFHEPVLSFFFSHCFTSAFSPHLFGKERKARGDPCTPFHEDLSCFCTRIL